MSARDSSRFDGADSPASSSESIPETDRYFEEEAREMLRDVARDGDRDAGLDNAASVLGSCALTLFFVMMAMMVLFEGSFTLRAFGLQEVVITGDGVFVVSGVFIGFALAANLPLARALKLDARGRAFALAITGIPVTAFVLSRYWGYLT